MYIHKSLATPVSGAATKKSRYLTGKIKGAQGGIKLN